jgi:hypothetical protein
LNDDFLPLRPVDNRRRRGQFIFQVTGHIHGLLAMWTGNGRAELAVIDREFLVAGGAFNFNHGLTS